MLERWIVLVLAVSLLAPGVAWPQEPETPSDGTRRMVERLQQIAQDADPDSPYFNGARVRRMRTRQPPADPRERATFHMMLGFEMLLAGESAEAVRFLERMKDTGESELVGGTFLSTLALAYLRLGEQENCLLHHTTDSCLLPIRGAGVHTVEDGSRQAIALYREILTAYPRDLTSRWLLNLAYMTVGEHPQGVPEAWRIPPEVFESEHPLPRFQDVAPGLGLDVTGLSGGTVTEDFDGDGHLDLMASSWGRGDPLRYFHNDAGTFEERTAEALLDGITGGLNLIHADFGADVGLAVVGFVKAVVWGDYDNDGRLDVFMSRLGEPNLLLRNEGPDSEGRWRFRDVTFRNDAGRRFQDVTSAGGFGHVQKGHGVAFTDLDNDGDQDVYAVLGGAFEGDVYQNVLFENPGTPHRWVTLRLVGVESSRDALGARLRLRVETADGDRDVYAVVSSGGAPC